MSVIFHTDAERLLPAVVHAQAFLRDYLTFRGHQRVAGATSSEPIASAPKPSSSSAFLALVMSICAIASRPLAPHDSRVLGIPSNISSAGLHYYRLARSLLSSTTDAKSLHQVQVRISLNEPGVWIHWAYGTLQALLHLAVFSEGVLSADTHAYLLVESKSMAEKCVSAGA